MTWRKRNQNNVIPIKVGIKNKEKTKAEERLKLIIASIDVKMQQSYWDIQAFDDAELQVLSNFGETIKFPSETTPLRALSVLSTFILKKQEEEEDYGIH